MSLVVRLPDPLLMAILGLFALAGLILLVLILPRDLRRRRKEDEEFQLYYESPKLAPWAMAVLWALMFLPLALVGYLLWLGWSPGGEGGVAGPHSFRPSVGAPSSPPLPAKPSASIPLFTGAVGFLGLVAGLGSLGLMLWIFLGDRIALWLAGPPDQPRTPAPLIEAVEESLDDLRREADARRAIILCYRRFEQVLAGLGVPRAPWETPMEFMREALSRLSLPSGPVRNLTFLFEISKFSSHPVGPAERNAAWESLMEIKRALDREAVRGSVA